MINKKIYFEEFTKYEKELEEAKEFYGKIADFRETPQKIEPSEDNQNSYYITLNSSHGNKVSLKNREQTNLVGSLRKVESMRSFMALERKNSFHLERKQKRKSNILSSSLFKKLP